MYVSRRYRLTFDAMLIPRLAIGFLLAAIAHEGAHAAVAALLRFRIDAFAVWPLRIYRGPAAWRAGWIRPWSAMGFISIAHGGARRARMREFAVVAAGPLASALMAAGCSIAIGAMGRQAKWVLDQLFLIALWSVLSAVGGLLPGGANQPVSDGTRLWQLITRRSPASPTGS